jgi:predicted nucleic acid-binding protein
MIIIKDSMVLIHLAKIGLLKKSCEYFGKVLIPDLVFNETQKGKDKGLEDALIVEELVADKSIIVVRIRDIAIIEKLRKYGIYRGEAEAVALYWQEKAGLLATDDDNVRKKKVLLDVQTIGSPIIILRLFLSNEIQKSKFEQSISELRKIGWFSNAILDTVLMEGENGRGNRNKIR